MEEEYSDNKSGFLNRIERIGNKLPYPVILFVILALIVVVVSEIAFRLNLSANYYDLQVAENVTVYANTLMNKEGIRYIFNSSITNFTGFAPLGTVLVTMLGVRVAESTGLISTGLKRLIQSVPDNLLTMVVVFAGVSCGFSANLLIGPNDALLTGITNAALESSGIDYEIAITGNWYFMIASTFLLTIVGSIVTHKITEPRLGEYTGDYVPENKPLTAQESKGLRNAMISLLVFVGLLAIMLVPENGAFVRWILKQVR